jgi:NhaP-type Na+/H+ or K+/H+ antiporter
MTLYISSTFDNSIQTLFTELTQLCSHSEIGASIGAILGFSVGLYDYLGIRNLDNMSTGALSIIWPTYTGYLMGAMPKIGVPVAVTALLMNEYHKCKDSDTSILPYSIQSLIDDEITISGWGHK